jgi:hypothetical protein
LRVVGKKLAEIMLHCVRHIVYEYYEKNRTDN